MVAATFALALAACSSAPDTTQHPPVATNVTLTAAQRQHIKLYTVEPGAYRKAVDTTGAVDFDNDRATSVLAPFTGPVTQILVSLGQHVTKGQPLAIVNSGDFAAAAETYRKAEVTARNARKLADVDKDLQAHDGISQREAEQAQTDAVGAESDRDAARAALSALGAGPGAKASGGVIRSPIDGTLVEKLITPGQLLQAGSTACFTVADLSQVWVSAQIATSDLHSIALGDPAEIETMPGAPALTGVVDNISAIVDPDTRAVPARVVVQNPGGLLKKQMYVGVRIRSRQGGTGLMVPVSAILRDDENLPFVYVAQPDGSFARQHVTLGYRDGEFYDVPQGLQPGTHIVADGAIFLQFMQSHELKPPALKPRQVSSMMNRLVAVALGQRLLVLVVAVILIGAGIRSLNSLPVDAYPDLSPPTVEIITQWPGHAAEEIERLITVPVENGMNGIPGAKVQRSVSLYGLSDVTINFTDNTDREFARQQAFNRIGDISLPSGVTPSISPLSSPSGLIYRYVLQSSDRSPMELKTIEDWTIEPAMRAVPGVADDSGFGGGTMQYQVSLDQVRIAALGLSVQQVETALGANNSNGGGGFYSQGGQFYYVRGTGRLETVEDIANVQVAEHHGTPVLIKDIGHVAIGIAPRLGQFGFRNQDDAVEGVVMLRTGEKTQDVLKRVEAKVHELNTQVLPRDVRIVPFYDRTDLVAVTTDTVEQNLLRGMLLVVVVLIFFLYDFRAGLIVATTIPLALLFAFICLDVQKASANLLSIGAIDFGILVDGAVVMVENIYRQLALRKDEERSVLEVIRDAAAEVDRPLFYAVAVIVVSFLPIYVLAGPSGILFRPMADTMIFALVGALIVTLTLLPVLCAWFMRKGVTERRNAAFEWIKSVYIKGLDFCLARPKMTTGVSALLLALSLLLIPAVGAEFMPKLDEGALWVRATMPYTISFDELAKVSPKVRAILASFPEVTTVASEHGRPDDGTDSTGFFNDEFYVGLKPYSQWSGAYHSKPELIAAIDRKLSSFPGIVFNYTQPAEDAVDEAETGLKSSLAVKVFGPDLNTLEAKGKAIKHVLEQVRGIDNVSLVQELGQPSLNIHIDRAKTARYGVNVDDINALIQTGIGGDVATQVVQQEKQFDLIVRLDQKYRDNPEEIGNILVPTADGQHIPLKELADIGVAKGASFIYRENNSRFIGVQFSVNGRDLAGAVEDAIGQVKAKVPLPEGYRTDWGGEYSEYTASRGQLGLILPLTGVLIFLLLFILYRNFKFPFITVLGVLLSAPVGGIVALWLTGTPFSVSSGIGFLALFGVSVQTAVVYISYVNELRGAGTPLDEAIREGAILRLRPIMMTALVAALGLLPAALATGVGTDTQRPFALVIVSGLFTRLLISIFLMPALYRLVARPDDRLEV